MKQFLFGLCFVLISLSGCVYSNGIPQSDNSDPAKMPLSTETAVSTPLPIRVETVQRVTTGLVVAMEFAEDGRLFYAEKQGGLFIKNVDVPNSSPQQIMQLDVAEGNENGLLGLTLDPNFAENNFFYVYFNVPNENKEPIGSRVVRYTFQDSAATHETILVDLPASPEQGFHFGGGLEIGPDGKLYLIFGDRNMPDAARDADQLPGSVLRYNLDGSIPDDNPFPNSPVYAYGIRNGFGLTWHPTLDLLYETENGVGCDDELNLILPGANYGWGVHGYTDCPYPDDTGNPPIYQWEQVVAPVGMTFYTGELMPELQGDLLVCGFNLQQIFQMEVEGNGRSIQSVTPFTIPDVTNLCRVAITQGPDGWLYTATNASILRIGR